MFAKIRLWYDKYVSYIKRVYRLYTANNDIAIRILMKQKSLKIGIKLLNAYVRFLFRAFVNVKTG